MWRRVLSMVALAPFALLDCSAPSPGSSASGDDGGDCYPDNDGTNDAPGPVEIVVTDTGFYAGSTDAGALTDAGMKTVITTQNSSTITLTLVNMGTMAHGFEVECTSVTPAYPDLPTGCASTACFPGDSTIAPIAPGTSMTVTFVTPVPDNLLYPFKSSAPGDATNPGLNGSDGSAWSLM